MADAIKEINMNHVVEGSKADEKMKDFERDVRTYGSYILKYVMFWSNQSYKWNTLLTESCAVDIFWTNPKVMRKGD